MINSIKRTVVSYLVRIIPETSFFGLKRFLYMQLGHSIGRNVRICSSVKILGNGVIEIGENTWIGPGCMLASSSKIIIGKNVDIAPQVYIGTGTHELMNMKDKVAGTGRNYDVFIGDGTWIGVRAIILPGTIVESMCMIAAGSLVSKKVESYTLVGGVPSKKIKDLKILSKEL